MTDLKNNEKYVIWHIEGGLGKNVAATALVKDLKLKFSDRKLIVVSSFPDIFLNNPFVNKVYRLGSTPYFFPTIDHITPSYVYPLRHSGCFGARDRGASLCPLPLPAANDATNRFESS